LLALPADEPARVPGVTCGPAELTGVVERFAAVPTEQRAAINGLEPARAPVILGGLLVLEEVLAHFGIAEIVTSERDILDGIALMAGRIALREGADGLEQPFGNTCC
jgi:exopolyphosphatase/guanosine-5'-triphosphate,3'-diphosphate pyrophosphatase